MNFLRSVTTKSRTPEEEEEKHGSISTSRCSSSSHDPDDHDPDNHHDPHVALSNFQHRVTHYIHNAYHWYVYAMGDTKELLALTHSLTHSLVL